MPHALKTPSLPKALWALVTCYFVASLAHFAHNAEFIAFYPGMPSWLSRENVYLAWLAVTGVGALGLDGLAHYTLALCSEHTLAANVTIWSEAALGLVLLLASSALLCRHACRASGQARRPGRSGAMDG